MPENPQSYFLDAQVNYQRKEFKAARIGPATAALFAQQSRTAYRLPVPSSTNSVPTCRPKPTWPRRWGSPNLPLARRLLIANYLRAGKPAKALETLEPVLSQIDKDSTFLTLAGQAYLQTAKQTRQPNISPKPAKLDPEIPTKNLAGHRPSGTRQCGGRLPGLAAISAEDKGIMADLALITAHLKTTSWTRPCRPSTFWKKQPDNPATHNLRARALLAKKDIAGARKNFDKALSINPTFFPAVCQPGQPRPGGQETGRGAQTF